jgi:hypothetical protein
MTAARRKFYNDRGSEGKIRAHPPARRPRIALPLPGAAEDGTMKTVGLAVGRIARPILKGRGFAAADLIMRWRELVGETLADNSAPERLVWPTGKSEDATLKLRVAPGFAPEVQHLAPLILERINTFYGYRAVTRLAISQGPVPRPPRPPAPPRPLTADELARLDGLLGGVTDEILKDSLARLGRAVLTGR